jgi:uncharacterized protein YcaQ
LRLSARQLNRATLDRQLLLRREPLSVVEAVRRIMAMQAQEPASPYLALWNRIEGFDPADLDSALAEGSVVKASLMRITLHAVAAEDYPLYHAAMRPSLRASRLYDRRFRDTGLTIDEVDAHEPELLAQSSRPRSTTEMTVALDDRFGERARGAWWAYRTYAPLHHAPTGGPWTFGGNSAFAAAPSTLPASSHEAGIEHLLRRYLRGFGPATVADIARFTLLQRSVVRAALERLADRLVRYEGPSGAELYDEAEGVLPADGPAPARLLPMWESTLLAYDDRDRVIPPEYRPFVIRRNGDVLATLLVDGRVAGVWRSRDGVIEAAAFAPLSSADWAGLEEEAASLHQLLQGRDPEVYRRYQRWWQDLPATHVRSIAG